MTEQVEMTQPARPKWRVQYKTAKEALPGAVRNVWPHMLIGLIFGFGLLGFGHLLVVYFQGHPRVAEYVGWLVPAVDHLAVGFVVSALAVLFYEWGAEAKELLIVTRRMVELVDRDLRPIISAVAHDAIFRGLDALEPMGRDLARAFRAIFESGLSLSEHGDGNSSVFFKFAVESLAEVAENIDKLARLSTKMKEKPSSKPEVSLHLPRASVVASRVLCDEIGRLTAGGTYSALSDVDSWRVLDEFEAAQKVAVTENGVYVRRVFFLPTQAKRDTGTIVTRHVGYARDWTQAAKTQGRYEVRVADETLFRTTVKDLSEERHFGVFSTGEAGAASIAFQVKRDDLSVFLLTGVTETHELVRDYERLWGRLANQKTADVAALLLTAEVKALRKGGRYCVVSDFGTWEGKGLSAFHRACIQGVKSHGLHIRRMFVVKKSDDVNACRAILKRHLHDQKLAKGDGSYEVRICLEREAVAAFKEKWQFGFFVAPGTETEEIRYIVAESSKQGMADFYMFTTEDLAMAPLFETFWLSIGSVAQRLSNIDGDWLH